MILISAQPSDDYFIWQLKVQIANLISLNFDGEYHILIRSCEELTPTFSEFIESITDPRFKIFLYEGNPTNELRYKPSLRPHILKKHFRKYKIKEFFYIDSDVIFRELPDFDLMPDYSYVSDTISYISAGYIKSKDERLFGDMCSVVGINPQTVTDLGIHSGGAQYLIRGVTSSFWQKVEKDCIILYELMKNSEQYYIEKSEEDSPIQSWCADMWAVLWNLWLKGKCEVHKELDFCWPTQDLVEWDKTKILHNAGVTEANKHDLFCKSDYIDKSPIGEDLSYVNHYSCSSKYAEIINSLTT